MHKGLKSYMSEINAEKIGNSTKELTSLFIKLQKKPATLSQLQGKVDKMPTAAIIHRPPSW